MYSSPDSYILCVCWCIFGRKKWSTHFFCWCFLGLIYDTFLCFSWKKKPWYLPVEAFLRQGIWTCSSIINFWSRSYDASSDDRLLRLTWNKVIFVCVCALVVGKCKLSSSIQLTVYWFILLLSSTWNKFILVFAGWEGSLCMPARFLKVLQQSWWQSKMSLSLH